MGGALTNTPLEGLSHGLIRHVHPPRAIGSEAGHESGISHLPHDPANRVEVATGG